MINYAETCAENDEIAFSVLLENFLKPRTNTT